MGKKYSLLTILITIWLTENAQGDREPPSLTVRTNVYDTFPTPSFLTLPKWIHSPEMEDFESVILENEFCYPLSMFCLRNDPRLCLLFDDVGYLAGVQIGYLSRYLSYIPKEVYDFSNPDFDDMEIYDVPVKTVTIYITDPDDLTNYGRRSTSHELVEGLWTTLNGELVRYDSMCQPNSPLIGDFNMVGCAPRVGQLYLRRYTENMVCNTGNYHYLMYDKGKLAGFGHGIPGIVPPGPHKTVYNYPNGTALKDLLPNPPPCFSEMEKYGLTVLGLWFIDDPWNIRCRECHCEGTFV